MALPELHRGECWICGCTDDHACLLGCWWVPDPTRTGDLCSSCLELAVTYQQASSVLHKPGMVHTLTSLVERTGIRAGALEIDLDCLVGHGLLERTEIRGQSAYTLARTEHPQRAGGAHV